MTKSEAEKLSKAIELAANKHSKQIRKNNTPYIYHPIKVSMILAEEGYDVRYQIAGIFHDMLEDTDVTEVELRAFCDDEMMEAIKLVTKEKGYKEEEYINRILKHPMAKAVKNADRIDNLRDLSNQSDPSFTRKYMKETEEFFYGRFSEKLDKIFLELAR